MSRSLLLVVSLLLTAAPGCDREAEDEFAPLDEETPTPEPRRPAVSGAAVVQARLTSEADLSAVRSRNPGLTLTVIRDAPKADVLLFDAPDAVRNAASKGRFAVLPADILEKVPPHFRGPGGRYVALSLRAHVIAARRLMANRPLSVLDLGDSRWRGKVARSVAIEPEFVDLISVQLSDHGVGKTGRLLGGLRVGTGETTADRAGALKSVTARRASLALIDHVDFHRFVFPTFDPAMNPVVAQSAVAEASTELLYPDRDGFGVPWTATVGGVASDAANPEAALATLDSLLSRAGQTAFAWSLREYPVVEDLSGPAGTLAPEEFTWSQAGFDSRAEFYEDAVDLAHQVDAPPEDPEAPKVAEDGSEAPPPPESTPTE